MVAHGGLGLAQGLLQVAGADLVGTGDHAEQAEAHGIGEGGEARGPGAWPRRRRAGRPGRSGSTRRGRGGEGVVCSSRTPIHGWRSSIDTVDTFARVDGSTVANVPGGSPCRCPPCSSSASTTPGPPRSPWGGSTTWPATGPSRGAGAPNRSVRSTPPPSQPWPRSASTSPRSTPSPGPRRSSRPPTSSSRWVAATPVRSSRASATRTGRSRTRPASASRRYARSATRSSTGSAGCSTSSASRV